MRAVVSSSSSSSSGHTAGGGYSVATQEHHHWGQCSTTINITPPNPNSNPNPDSGSGSGKGSHCDQLTKVTIRTRAVDDSGWIEELSPTFTVAVPTCVAPKPDNDKKAAINNGDVSA